MNDKIEMLGQYLKANIAPILISNIPSSLFNTIAVIIPSNISKEDLYGKIENNKFEYPKWYNELSSNSKKNMIIVDNLSLIPIDEQLKFHELLKYRKIGDLKIKDNIMIMVISDKVSKETINKDIYSLLVHIED
ncbi:MAG: hypothetical protein J6J17_05735 [Bacilli bacterium]|nr:hypothetical protein [Bacilli bacterium]